MIKKFLSIFIVVILSLVNCAFAQETNCSTEYVTKADGSQKVVFSVFGNVGDEIVLKLYNLDADTENAVTKENIETSVLYIDQKTVGGEGKCRFAFIFPSQFHEGQYAYIIQNASTGERLNNNIEYYLAETLDGVLSSFYNGSLSTLEAFEKLYKYRNPLGINSLLFEAMYDEGAVPLNAYGIFKADEYKVADSNVYAVMFNDILYMDAINYMNNTDNLLSLTDKNGKISVAEELGLLSQTDELKQARYENFLTLPYEKKAYFVELLKEKRPFQTKDEFVQAFNECAFLCKLNLAANASEIELLINESTDLLENGGAFAAKSSQEQAKAARTLYSYKNVKSSKAFSDEIKKAISGNPGNIVGIVPGGNTGGGNSGGGGGGGGGGRVSASTSIAVDVELVEAGKQNAQTKDKVELKFKDMESVPWAEAPVTVLSGLGVINGKSEDAFAPNDNVLREELVKMAVCLFNVYDKDAVSSFEDINGNDWFASYVASAEKTGAVNGISEKEFGAGLNITREQAITVLYRFAIKCGIVFPDNAQYIPFDDDNRVSDYAKEAIRAFAGSNIVSGYENLIMPDSYCSRAEVAKILYNIYLLSLEKSE